MSRDYVSTVARIAGNFGSDQSIADKTRRSEINRTDAQYLMDRLQTFYDFQSDGHPLRNCMEWILLRKFILP